MTPSIRTFLLINLLLSITLITSLAIVGNIFLEHRDLRDHLDAQLSLIALTIQAFSSDGLDPEDIPPIQAQLNKIPTAITQIENEDKRLVYAPAHELIQFQVWDKKNKLILKTPDAPSTALYKEGEGLTDQWIDGKPWRAFSIYSPQSELNVVVTERYDFREEVENHITKDSIIIMLLTYPFLGLLIWIIVGRGLDSLKRVTRAVRQRDPGYLEPVDIDIAPSEVKPLVIALNNLFSRLKEALDREKRFTADAAHELRTPLAALRAHTQVALNTQDKEERNATLNKVLISVDRCTHAVEQMLTLTRMSSEEIASTLAPVDLVKQAQETIASLAPIALKKETEIELILSEPRVIIDGIPAALGILIRNLIDNAIRYTPAGSLIQVLVRQKGERAFLHVIDNGPGIPQNLQKRVFERFYRVLGSKTQGTGLGLGIVQKIAALHNARVRLTTPASGTGLEVIVTFPAPKKK